MYLVKYNQNYFKIMKSVRDGSKVKKVIVKYIGRLSTSEYNRLKLSLKATKEKDLDKLLKDTIYKDQDLSQAKTEKVTFKEVRSNVFKKKIDKKWLKKAYLQDEMTIGSIAQILGVSKDRVRDHLEEMGFAAEMRLKLARSRGRNSHIEFGWHLVNGEKIKDPVEYKIIEEMIKWRQKEKLSFEKIAKKLTEMGVKGRLGASKWDRGVVRRIIMRNKNELDC